MKSAKLQNDNEIMKQTIKRMFILFVLFLIVGFFLYQVRDKVLAEQSGSSPESGVTSRIKTIYDSLVSLSHGSDSAGGWGDWGVMWNRIRSAAEWTPSGDATEADVAGGKTFHAGGSSRGIKIGSMYENLLNGSDTGGVFPGGSQTDGGVDDLNNFGSFANGGYSRSWTSCTNDNNYCDTGLSSADARDDTSGLIWSKPCYGNGCTTLSDPTATTYSWDNSGANNNGKTAKQLCESGIHGESGWYLPHQKQILLAYVNGSYGNLESTGISRLYISATTISDNTTRYWAVTLSNGYVGIPTKNFNGWNIRCVRRD